MFYKATAFNKDLSSWNVSNGQEFVSENKNEKRTKYNNIIIILRS